jgi:polyhydroxyalkanoate synthesis regulator phasin
MWKKVLGLVAGMLAVVLLITGIMTAVNADSANTDVTAPAGLPPGPHAGPHPGRGFGPAMGSDMLEKVAVKLNIDKATLQAAFKQVMLEGQQARSNDMFAAWVKDGKLTQEQADAHKTWQAAKPADVPGFRFFDSAKSTEMLDKLVTDGKLTRAQADAHKAWIAQKPAVELPRQGKPVGAGGPTCGGRGLSDNSTGTWRHGGPVPSK